MPGLFEIQKIVVDDENLTARIVVNPQVPLMTSDNVEATSRLFYLAPGIIDHACLGDAGTTFKDCMGHTSLPHVLEHLTIEIMKQVGAPGVLSGRTKQSDFDSRLFDIDLSCPDDLLTIGALSSAIFMMEWAYVNFSHPAPDFAGTVEGLKRLVDGYNDAY